MLLSESMESEGRGIVGVGENWGRGGGGVRNKYTNEQNMQGFAFLFYSQLQYKNRKANPN